mmetsp:Transcript_8597/g.15993  ORF Transcript_8597/g.15993 Transcript_8597/m.15993 type:complete len:450 (+) Transcript_8597:61-1410(+)
MPSPLLSSVLPIAITFLFTCVPTVRCWVATFPIAKLDPRHLNMMAPQTTSHEMELWLDKRQAAKSVAGDCVSIIAPSRLDFVDAVIVDEGDDQNPTWAKKLYSVKNDRNDGNRPSKLFRRGDNQPVGAIVDVSTPSGQDTALGLVGSVEWIVVTCEEDRDEGWIMIPAENLISSCHNTGTKIAAFVDRVGDVGGLARALELGIDALCVDAVDANENEDLWNALIDAKEERKANADVNNADDTRGGGTGGGLTDPSGPTVVQGTCQRVASSGGKSTVLADRVCIDLVQSLKPTEGCWIGSSAKIMALVLSEAAQSSFVPSRPFRVNAGPVHSYVVMGDGTSTKYLSELSAGDEVLVLAVGRLKVEIRPCVQVGLFVPQSSLGREENASYGQVFLQQAETVRLGQTLGSESFLRITDLEYQENVQASDVLLRVTGLGTHVGKSYSGKVSER